MNRLIGKTRVPGRVSPAQNQLFPKNRPIYAPTPPGCNLRKIKPRPPQKSHFDQRIVVFFDVSCNNVLYNRLSLLSEIILHELDAIRRRDWSSKELLINAIQ
jgi:hypothetical protein